jgi:hypothetical protein
LKLGKEWVFQTESSGYLAIRLLFESLWISPPDPSLSLYPIGLLDLIGPIAFLPNKGHANLVGVDHGEYGLLSSNPTYDSNFMLGAWKGDRRRRFLGEILLYKYPGLPDIECNLEPHVGHKIFECSGISNVKHVPERKFMETTQDHTYNPDF